MKKRVALIPILILAATLLSGCAKPKPFVYHPGTEIPQGPGLFSKEKGEFTIYDSNKNAAAAKEQEASGTAAQAKPTAADTQAPAVTAPPADSEAFRQFQNWKKEQKDFEAFQEWKRSNQGSREYEEFQEWKRWKTYMQWIDEQKKTK
ncbi:MAG: hypothetical protein WAU91_13075 [Desulfatitalea sp.]